MNRRGFLGRLAGLAAAVVAAPVVAKTVDPDLFVMPSEPMLNRLTSMDEQLDTTRVAVFDGVGYRWTVESSFDGRRWTPLEYVGVPYEITTTVQELKG